MKLIVKTADGQYPVINGIPPELVEDCGYRHAIYSNLCIQVQITGDIRIANGFIRSRYVHMGFQEVISYRTVKELSFIDGILNDTRDLSDSVKKVRKAKADVEKWCRHNRVNYDLEAMLKKRFTFDYDISRTFMRSFEPIAPDGILKTLDEIRQWHKYPLWFAINFGDYYEEHHEYHFKLDFFKFLGCPEPVTKFLRNLVCHNCTEQQVAVAFIETLKDKPLGNLSLETCFKMVGEPMPQDGVASEEIDVFNKATASTFWGETLDIIMRKQFEQANVPSSVKRRIEEYFVGTTLEKW